MWTIERVKDELNKLCVADGLPEITIPVSANARLTRTLGRVKFLEKSCTPVGIDFSQRLLDNGTDRDLINVIKHEYVHYYLLCTTGVDHGHDALFKSITWRRVMLNLNMMVVPRSINMKYGVMVADVWLLHIQECVRLSKTFAIVHVVNVVAKS